METTQSERDWRVKAVTGESEARQHWKAMFRMTLMVRKKKRKRAMANWKIKW